MKKYLILSLVAIAMILIISSNAFAETVLLDRSLPSFDEESAYKESDYYGSYGVRGTVLQGNGSLSLFEKDGNKMIKMSIEGPVESGYNYAMLSMLTNRNLRDYYKKGVIISYDLIPPENGSIIFQTYGSNYVSRRLYSVDNGVLIPAAAGADITDPDKQAALTYGQMYNIKLAIDAGQRTYSIFLNGVQIGDTYQLTDYYIPSSSRDEIPPMFLSLRTNDSTVEYPLECFVDNLKIISYNNEGIEISSFFDILEDGNIVNEFNPGLTSSELGMDIFNNTTEEKEISVISLKYETNANGYNRLTDYNIKKLSLEAGYNREIIGKLLIPDNSEESLSKLIFTDSLYNFNITAPVYKLTNDGTSVLMNKTETASDLTADKVSGEVSNVDREVTVSGYITDGQGNGVNNIPVGITVLNADVSIEDFVFEYDSLDTETDNLQSLIYTDLSATDIDGKYCFKLEMPEEAPMGDYLIIIKSGNKEYKTTMRYLTTADKQAAVMKINESLDKEAADFLAAIEENEFPLSLFLDYTSTKEMYDSVKNKEEFFKLIKSFGKYSEEYSQVSDSINNFNVNLDNAILLSQLKEIDDITELKTYAEAIAEEAGLQLSGITEENNSSVYEALAAFEDFASLKKINRCIAEAVILYEIPHAVNWGAVKKAVENGASALELNISDDTTDYSAVYHQMYKEKNTFTDYDKLERRFNELIKKCKKIQNNNSGGGGASGGNSKASRGTNVSANSSVVSTPQLSSDTKTIIDNSNDMPFSDVSKDFWGYNIIKDLYQKGIINGKTKTEFEPLSPVKREEFIAMLVRACSLDIKETEAGFSDIDENDWFKQPVYIAAANGLINGRPDGTFGAGEYITRQDIAVIIANMISNGYIQEKEEKEYIKFKDIARVSDYAINSVIMAQKQGVISGYSEGDFRPFNNASRAETAAIIQRLTERMSVK